MKNTLTTILTQLTQERRKRRKQLNRLTALALIVAITVAWSLHMDGIAIGHTEFFAQETATPAAENSQATESTAPASSKTSQATTETSDESKEPKPNDALASPPKADKSTPTPTPTAGAASEPEDLEEGTPEREEAADWEQTLPKELSGDWGQDLVAVAQSQLGYEESETDLDPNTGAEPRRGFTRYGAWEGQPFGNWHVAFVAFCQSYAGIPARTLPTNAGAQAWQAGLTEVGQFTTEAESAQSGDYLFYDDKGKVRLAIISDRDGDQLTLIEGDYRGKVAEHRMALDDGAIRGIGTVNKAYEAASGTSDDVTSHETPAEERPETTDEPVINEDGKETEESVEDEDENDFVDDLLSLPLRLNSSALRATATPLVTPGTTGANAWQVAAEPYVNTTEKKLIATGDDIRAMKKVVPTDVEDEFLVYLSLDKREYIDKWLQGADFWVLNNNSLHNTAQGTVLKRKDISGQKKKLNPTYKEKGAHKWSYHFNIALTYNGKSIGTIRTTRYGDTNAVPNGAILIKKDENATGMSLSDEFVFIQSANLSATTNVTVDAKKLEAVGADLGFSTKEVIFDKVTDALPSHMEYLGQPDGNFTAEPTFDGTVLSWQPVPDDTVSAVKESDGKRWFNDVAQLTYRVRLKTETSGFKSAAQEVADGTSFKSEQQYSVGKATLAYQLNKTPGSSDAFHEPKVGGLLYSVKSVKVDEKDNPLAGATFELSEQPSKAVGEKPDGANVGPPSVSTVTTVAPEAVIWDLENKPWGRYTMRETKAPEGYEVDGIVHEVPLCYTNNKELLAPDSTNNNMRYKGSNITIKNDSFRYDLVVKKVNNASPSEPLDGAEFSLQNGEEIFTGTSGEVGSGLTTFAATEKFKVGDELTLIETKAPEGYIALDKPIRFQMIKGESGYEVREIGETGETVSPPTDGPIQYQVDAENHLVTVTVTNIGGAVLPETGGNGHGNYTLGGFLLMAFALFNGLRRRQKSRLY